MRAREQGDIKDEGEKGRVTLQKKREGREEEGRDTVA
jgi:hypothetical protein